MDARKALDHLEEPDPRAVERIWGRFERSRRRRSPVWLLIPATAVAAAVAAVALWPEFPRTVDVTAEAVAWSDVVAVDADGAGQIVGTDREATVHWRAGTVQVAVTPNTGTRLAVVTDEARVEVVGTEFTVRRDALGSTVAVQRGRVRVQCALGWSGDVTPEDAPRTCLPVTPGGWLGRADALIAAGADDTAIGEAVDRGLADAPPGPIAGELLVRRVQLSASRGDVDGTVAGARAYLDGGYGGRDAEVRRLAGWLVLRERGCGEAAAWLSPLADAGSGPEAVLLAECDPVGAAARLAPVLDALDPEWRARADALLGAAP